jgi:UbiD family decarboxylase
MLFESVRGSDMRLATGALGASSTTYAMAIGTTPDGINAAWVNACRDLIKPSLTQASPAQAVRQVGEHVALSTLPIPVWTPGKDASPYITTSVVTRDRASGSQNMGVYRTMVRDERSVVTNFAPNRQGFMNIASWHAAGEAAPVAWVIGAEPAVQLASMANLAHGVDEIDLAGALVGEPIELVRCLTHDLRVPASAEIIIEGEVRVGETALEGPFGEFAGYMGPVEQRPIVRITAITYRPDAIFYGYTSQMPPSESTVMQSLTNAGVLQKLLVIDHSEVSVEDVHIDLTYGGFLGHALIAMTPRYPGHGKKVGRLVAAMTPLKRVTVLDVDVDLRDSMHVDWALNARYNPVRDTVIIDDVFFPINMDPSVRTPGTPASMGSKVVIDATAKVDAGSLSLPPQAVMQAGLERWHALGFPAFEIPKRARLRIDRA